MPLLLDVWLKKWDRKKQIKRALSLVLQLLSACILKENNQKKKR